MIQLSNALVSVSHVGDVLLTMTVLSVLLSLGSNRLGALVKIMAFQGIVVSLIPFFLEHHGQMSTGSIILLQIMLLIKGLLIPGFMYAAVKKIKIKLEVEPIIGYNASLFAGLIFILLAAFITNRLQISLPVKNELLMIAAITTLAAGLFLIMSRHKALTQVIGYLMMENGIYLIGTALAKQTHTMYVVEFGVLLDLLVGIMIMGIIVHNINSSYDDVDTALLGQLKDN
ncbi:MAG: hydrogenase [Desulfobulbaceae bacterium]|jgi:hydrogenase-4 component E|nr:hydrogenase [Desulfobulbaceae bacterium]